MKVLNKRFFKILHILADIVAITLASVVGVAASESVKIAEIGFYTYLYALISNAIILVAVFMIFKMYSNIDSYVGTFDGLKLILCCIIVTVFHFVEMQFILKLHNTVD